LFICSVNIICEYIKYIAKAKGRYQIHSPFVYELVDVCFSQKVAKKDKKTLARFTSTLYNDKNNYEFDTQGAGSKRKKTFAQIKQYATNARTKGKYWTLLYKISTHYKPTRILELGTNFGFGSLAFSLGFFGERFRRNQVCSVSMRLTSSWSVGNDRASFYDSRDRYLMICNRQMPHLLGKRDSSWSKRDQL